MPTYDYFCVSCNEEFSETSKIADREIPTQTPCKNCGGTIKIKIGACPLGDPIRMGLQKPDEGFRDLLRTIKKNNHGSTIDVK